MPIIDYIGLRLIQISQAVYLFLELFVDTFFFAIKPPLRFKLVIQQIYFVANKSVWIIVFCVSFAAMVTILESSFHIKLVIANDTMVPGFAVLLILRELGSVLAALLLTSKVGAGYAAEVSTMKVTEQIDALHMLGINPVQYIVVPRFLACFISGLLLSVISNIVCIVAAMGVSVTKLGLTAGTFILAMNRFVIFKDLVFAIIKGGVFAAIIPLISCYYGFRSQPGAEGVGAATTKSVVVTSVTIIILDFLLSWLFSHFY